MRSVIQEVATEHSPESLVEQLRGLPSRLVSPKPGEGGSAATAGIVLLRSRLFDSPQARYSFVAARPFLTFRSFGSRCEIAVADSRVSTPWRGEVERRLLDSRLHFGNPWRLLDRLLSRYELLDEIDLPFPLGGCFGYWGYELKNFVEPKLSRRALDDLELPDCHVGFYDSLVVFDHHLGKTWIISTGLNADGARSESRAKAQLDFWSEKLAENPDNSLTRPRPGGATLSHPMGEGWGEGVVTSSLSRSDFVARVEQAQRYIRSGDIYQVNLSQRLTAEFPCGGESPGEPLQQTTGVTRPARGDARPTSSSRSGWELFQRLSAVSPAPFSAFLDAGEFQIASSSPELFLRLNGDHIQTRPIKGTRPRSTDPTRDAQLSYELQTSAKEMAELVMITDLLRNDLGKVCEFGSVRVPELIRLERYPQVQHLVSTVEGHLRRGVTHLEALASCFPGGSITGAPKFRAMEIIDELEPIARGPYTGALGYLGFNRESQLSILIRTALCLPGRACFHVGAGIVADSNPEAEYEETLAKAAGFLAALKLGVHGTVDPAVATGGLPSGKSRV
jgi:para-aminobenzoate synthetase component 1